jgi:hypothetical protein
MADQIDLSTLRLGADGKYTASQGTMSPDTVRQLGNAPTQGFRGGIHFHSTPDCSTAESFASAYPGLTKMHEEDKIFQDLTALEAGVFKYQEQIKTLQDQLSQKSQEIQQLNTDLTTKNTDLQQKDAEIAQLRAELAARANQTDLDKANARIAVLEAKNAALERENAKLKDAADNVVDPKKLKLFNTQVRAVQQQIAELLLQKQKANDVHGGVVANVLRAQQATINPSIDIPTFKRRI